MRKALLLLSASFIVSGCAIHQTVSPVERFEGRQVCIVRNPAVRETFLDAYKAALVAKGYDVQVLEPKASLIACPITSTYTANWRWDMALYMAYAELKVYNNAKPSGEAKYDALRGGGNMGKFISAEKKIKELVDQLFPGNATERGAE